MHSFFALMTERCYDPFSSVLIDGCLEHGKDMLQGGSECPVHWSVYAYGIGLRLTPCVQ